VVAKLAVNPSIGKIFCLVRASSKAQALQRVKESMLQRKVYHTLPLSSRRKIVALPSDLADARLGLSDDDYAAVAANLRSVIHCAWSVNFNMQLSSFEKGNIAGVHHLLALCKSSSSSASSQPASFNFCSSVSTVVRCTVTPIPESLPELAWAQGMGYAQSKSVAEHICARAAAQGVKARVLRVGQIVGDTANGVWNAQEAVPMMMQTAVTVGSLPKLKETPSWLPVDIVAEAVSDISLSDTDAGFTHVMHPKTFSFVNDLLPALRATGLKFEEVEPKEWIQRLRSSNPDPTVNPPIKLVDFFASKYDKDEFAPSKPYSTEVACSLSPALANAPLLSEEFVKQFIGYFQKNAWNTQASTAAKKTAVFMAGPAGTGKSTVGTTISSWLCVPFIEGDNLHSRTAVDKMKSGTALSDEDRTSWLGRICNHARESIHDLAYDSVIVSCSALKRSYRSQIRASLAEHGIEAVFVDLQASRDVLLQRLQARKGHYMSAAMVDSQIVTYESATAEESDVLPVDAEQDQEDIVEEVKWLLQNTTGLAKP
jgi:carbohydrate kinase (thermoresistant glucokinase family)